MTNNYLYSKLNQTRKPHAIGNKNFFFEIIYHKLTMPGDIQ